MWNLCYEMILISEEPRSIRIFAEPWNTMENKVLLVSDTNLFNEIVCDLPEARLTKSSKDMDTLLAMRNMGGEHQYLRASLS